MTISIYRGNDYTPSPNKLFKMPGGEWHINGPELYGAEVAFVQGSTADDLIALAVWADAVRRDGGIATAIIPYLPGARQDRRQPGEALSARVYAEMINAMKLNRVLYLDPHSAVMPAMLDRAFEVPLADVIEPVLYGEEFTGVIAPDAGATKRAWGVASFLGVPMFQAFKKRDPTFGKLAEFTCVSLPSEGRLLVVDDICDGGGTFKGLADATGLPSERLALYVTHGVFSRGAETLGEHYGAIYTTDVFPITNYSPPITRRAAVLPIMSKYI